jgi:hypothetical protein
VCSENPNSGGRKRFSREAGSAPGFAQRLSFGKAAAGVRAPDIGAPRCATKGAGAGYFTKRNWPLKRTRACKVRAIGAIRGAMVRVLQHWLDTHQLPAIAAAVLGVIVALSTLMVVGGYLLVTP